MTNTVSAQSVPAGTVIQLVDGGQVIASYTTAEATASFIFSSAAIVSGKSYTVATGGTAGTTVQTVTAGQHTGGRMGSRR